MATQTQQQQPAETVTSDQLEAQLDRMLEKADRSRGAITLTSDGVEIGDFAGVQRYAQLLVAAGLVPKIKEDTDAQQLARATVSILLGRRIGLSPEQAVQAIYVVNNRPTLFGDAPLAIARQHPAWDESGFREYWYVAGKAQKSTPTPDQFRVGNVAAVCETLRKGASEPYVITFSVSDAKQAGLFGKNGSLYGTYPQRMLKFRARGYCLRDNFGDALRGIGIKELHEPEPDAIEQDVSGSPAAATRITEIFGDGAVAESSDNGAAVTAALGLDGEPAPEPEPPQAAAEPETPAPTPPAGDKLPFAGHNPEPGKGRKAKTAPTPVKATPQQIEHINRLQDEGDIGEAYLCKWAEANGFKFSRSELTQEEASAMIEMLSRN